MKLKTPAMIVLTEYILAPWHLRLRWWLEGRIWCWCKGMEATGTQSPEQTNPLWRKW